MDRKLYKTEHPGIYRRGTRFVVRWKENKKRNWRTFVNLEDARNFQSHIRLKSAIARYNTEGALLQDSFARFKLARNELNESLARVKDKGT